MTDIILGKLPTVENCWLNTVDSKNPETLANAHQIISNIIYCTLSTCSRDGFPWSSPVFFTYDDDLNIYWTSAVVSQHSENIYNNQGRVSIAIYDSRAAEGTGSGVYFLGIASELVSDDFERVFELIQKRAGKRFDRTFADYQDASPRRIYKFCPHQVWITGSRVPVGKQLVDTKIQLDLLDLKARF